MPCPADMIGWAGSQSVDPVMEGSVASRMENDLKDRLRASLVKARKGRDKATVLVISTMISEIRNREIELGSPVDDGGVEAILVRGIKQRQDAAGQMRDAGRVELAEVEEAQMAILREFLPPPLTEAEVRALVRAAIEDGVSEMGPLMGRLMPAIRGRFDGKEANRIVREEMS